MGCHTWFSYQAEVQPTYEEIREKYIEFLKKDMGYYERYISGTLSDNETWLFDEKSGNTIEKSTKYIEIIKRVIRRIENRTCKLATMLHAGYNSCVDLEYCKRNGMWYKDADICDIFRIGNYPEDELLSLQEVLDFFEKHNDKISWGGVPDIIGKENVIKRMEDFFNTYPNGRVRFG